MGWHWPKTIWLRKPRHYYYKAIIKKSHLCKNIFLTTNLMTDFPMPKHGQALSKPVSSRSDPKAIAAHLYTQRSAPCTFQAVVFPDFAFPKGSNLRFAEVLAQGREAARQSRGRAVSVYDQRPCESAADAQTFSAKLTNSHSQPVRFPATVRIGSWLLEV